MAQSTERVEECWHTRKRDERDVVTEDIKTRKM